MADYPSPFTISIDRAAGWRPYIAVGSNAGVAQSPVPVTTSGTYRTPKASAAVYLPAGTDIGVMAEVEQQTGHVTTTLELMLRRIE